MTKHLYQILCDIRTFTIKIKIAAVGNFMQNTIESQYERLKSFECAFRTEGLKLTHQRMEIFRELIGAFDHPSAESVYQRIRIKIPTISMDTVYRTLATLTDHKLIYKVETTESQARFETQAARHHHVICSVCNEITDFNFEPLNDAELPECLEAWGRVETKNLIVYGVCKRCLEKG